MNRLWQEHRRSEGKGRNLEVLEEAGQNFKDEQELVVGRSIDIAWGSSDDHHLERKN